MAQEKTITEKYIKDLSYSRLFGIDILTKDYYLTKILYLLKNLDGIYFKGGTALQKIFLDYTRLSEDLDFTVTEDVKKKEKEIKDILKTQSFVKRTENGKSVDKFIRIVVYYDDFSGKEDFVYIDLNERAKLLSKPEIHKINHFYNDFIPSFSVNTLSKKEMIAEKVAATIGRNMPRDHFDVYQIIKKDIPIDMRLVKEKCRQSDSEFSIIKMFNRANKLKNRWDEDLVPLLAKETSFQEVITTQQQKTAELKNLNF